MKYINTNERITRKELGYEVNVGSLLVFLICFLTALVTLVFVKINGWTSPNETGENNLTFYGVVAICGIAIFGFCLFAQWIEEKYPFEKKRGQTYSILGFRPEYLHHKHYKEAYDDLIMEIESGDYAENESEWDRIFTNLTAQAQEFAQKDKMMKKKQQPRKDYVAEFKESNELYFKGLQ